MPDVQFAPKTMTTNSAPSPYVVSSTPNHPSWDAYKAFDGNVSGFNYCLMFATAGVLTLDLGAGNAYELHSYKISTNFFGEGARAPKDWTLEVSNNGSSWTTIDTRTNETGWTNGEERTYTPSNAAAGAFRHFKLNISVNNGDSITQVGELWLYGVAGGGGGASKIPVIMHHLRQQGIS